MRKNSTSIEKEGGTQRELCSERYTSLDLLRIVCMFMIVLGHGIGSQPALQPGEMDSMRMILGVLGTFCGVAVNCFVLISGFFLIHQKFRISRLIRLAVEVLFYSWLILLVNAVFLKQDLGIKDLLTLVMPISFEHFWFISAYFGLSLLSPVLNMALHAMNRRQHLSSIAVLVVCFSLWSDLLPRANPFGADSGYCLTWFVVLYVIAAYIRIYVDMTQIRKNARRNLGIYAIMMLVVFFLNTGMSMISVKIPVLKTYEMDSFFSRYNCSLVLVGSLALFVAFLGTNITRGKRFLHSVSKLTLGVYLIHGGPFTSQYIWDELSAAFQVRPTSLFPVKIMAMSICLFVICLLIDFVRQCVFRLWEDSRWFNGWMKKLDSAVFKVGELICRF